MKKTDIDKIERTLNKDDFFLLSNEKQGNEYVSEIETYSPAGENVIITIWHNNTKKGFIDSFTEYASDFDADEHATMWIENRHRVNGVPQSARTLIDDADAIADMLEDMAIKLNAIAA